jgi:hypothetical protein
MELGLIIQLVQTLLAVELECSAELAVEPHAEELVLTEKQTVAIAMEDRRAQGTLR